MATYEIKPRVEPSGRRFNGADPGRAEPEFHIVPDPAKLLVQA